MYPCAPTNTCSEKNFHCLGGTWTDTVPLDCLKKWEHLLCVTCYSSYFTAYSCSFGSFFPSRVNDVAYSLSWRPRIEHDRFCKAGKLVQCQSCVLRVSSSLEPAFQHHYFHSGEYCQLFLVSFLNLLELLMVKKALNIVLWQFGKWLCLISLVKIISFNDFYFGICNSTVVFTVSQVCFFWSAPTFWLCSCN